MQKDNQALSTLPRYLLWLFAAGLFLDIPASRAYNEHEAWTKTLGAYFFHGVNEKFGIPLPFTLFEILSYGCMLLILAHWGSQRSRLWVLIVLLAILVPVACALATFTGFLRGNLVTMAFSQLHFVPMSGAWLLIGYYLGTRGAALRRAAKIVFWICIWRSCYALYVYFIVYSGSMGKREYLIDHAASSFLVLGMVYAVCQAYVQRQHFRRLLGYGGAVLLMFGPYILNDRRTSYVGFLIAALVLPWVVPLHFRRKMMSGYILALIAGSTLLLAKVAVNQEKNSLVGALQNTAAADFDQLDYRQIENYNLMLGVIDKPLLGMGFGSRFPQAVPLPDISFSFDLFDAIPHNTLLFLWTFAGPLGIAAMSTLSCFLLLIIARVGRLARSPGELIQVFLGLFAVVQWLMYVCFDMGLLESRSSMLVGVLGAGLFPVYGHILVEQLYAKYRGTQVLSVFDRDIKPVRVRKTLLG